MVSLPLIEISEIYLQKLINSKAQYFYLRQVVRNSCMHNLNILI